MGYKWGLGWAEWMAVENGKSKNCNPNRNMPISNTLYNSNILLVTPTTKFDTILASG